MTLAPGTSFASYRIIEPLGRGGMASVYKAYEATLDRYVAVKVLPAEFLHDPTFAERFQREAKVVARLEHPNIIPIYAYGIDERQRIPWMAMRLVPGGALHAIVRGSARRVPFERSLLILRGAADALDYAHAKGVVHRDVKPQNILLDEAERVYLADFGIAKMVESKGGLTQTGMISGTPQYMAPEQATGLTVDKRADIYALGIVAFEMFTGRVPFTADTPVAILMKHVSEAMPLPSVTEVPECLMRPVLKCTAKQAADRWDSASDFVRALERGLVELSGTRVASASGALPLTATAPAVTAVPGRTAPGLSATRRATPTEPAAASSTYVPPLAGTRPADLNTAASRPAEEPSAGVPPVLVALLVGGLGAVLVAGAVVFWLFWRTPAVGPTPVAAIGSPRPTGAVAPTPTAPPPTLPDTPSPEPTPRPEPSAAPSARPSARPSAPLSTPPPSYPPVTTLPRPTAPPATAPPPTRPPRPAEPAASGQVRTLMEALAHSSSADERWRAAETLGNLGHEARPAVPALGAALRDRNDQVRWRAAEALGKLGPDAAEAVPALADSLDRSDMLAQESAKALGRIGPDARPAVPALAAALTRADVYLRREAVKALQKLGPQAEEAVPTLIEALQDKDKTVRSEACKVLGRIGPAARAATPALQAALRDPDDLVRLQAGEALKRVSGQ